MALRLALLPACLVGLVACSQCFPANNDCQYAVFEDVKHARSMGAFDKGWLPEWLPDEATDIHELHDLDTNAQAITFSIGGMEFENWLYECRPVKSVEPPVLETRKFPHAVHKNQFIRECDGFYVVKDDGGLVHLWRP